MPWSQCPPHRRAAADLDGLAEAGLPRERVGILFMDQQFDLEYRAGRWVAVAAFAGVEAPRLAVAEASARRDWRNDYAQALLDLRPTLKNAPDDRSRRLLQEMRHLIGGVNGDR